MSQGLDPSGIAFKTVIVGAVASTIVAILLFAISLSVVGAIITAVLSFIDVFLTLLCQGGVGGACFGVIASVTDAISRAIYSGGTTIDFEHNDPSGTSDLVRIRDLDTTLADPNLGLRVGNKITYRATIQTTIFQKPASGAAADMYPQDYFFGEATCASRALSIS